MTIEEAIKSFKNLYEDIDKENHLFVGTINPEFIMMAIKALEEVERYRFEIAECKAILDNPTPDVTENDKKRAMYVIQTFPDMRGV